MKVDVNRALQSAIYAAVGERECEEERRLGYGFGYTPPRASGAGVGEVLFSACNGG